MHFAQRKTIVQLAVARALFSLRSVATYPGPTFAGWADQISSIFRTQMAAYQMPSSPPDQQWRSRVEDAALHVFEGMIQRTVDAATLTNFDVNYWTTMADEAILAAEHQLYLIDNTSFPSPA